MMQTISFRLGKGFIFVNHAKDGLTGSAWGDWANYTASPLRAFENELGVQDPVGFWDPAGCLGHHCLQENVNS